MVYSVVGKTCLALLFFHGLCLRSILNTESLFQCASGFFLDGFRLKSVVSAKFLSRCLLALLLPIWIGCSAKNRAVCRVPISPQDNSVRTHFALGCRRDSISKLKYGFSRRDAILPHSVVYDSHELRFVFVKGAATAWIVVQTQQPRHVVHVVRNELPQFSYGVGNSLHV